MNKKTPVTLESRFKQLEKRLTKLEALVEKKFARKKRQYTEGERKTIRARLLAGQETARKRREAELVHTSNGKATKETKQMGSPASGGFAKVNTAL